MIFFQNALWPLGAIALILGSLGGFYFYPVLGSGLVIAIFVAVAGVFACKTIPIKWFIFSLMLGLVGTLIQINARLDWELPMAWWQQPVTLVGVVESNNNQQLVVKLHQACRVAECLSGHVKVRLYDNREQEIHAGELWTFEARLKPIHGYANPGSFFAEKNAFVQNIRAVGRIDSAEYLGKQHWPYYLRQQLIDRFHLALPAHAQAGLVWALLSGQRNKLTQQTMQAFQSTGTAHLMAISGLHIGGIAAGLFWFIQKLAKRRFYHSARAAQIAAILSLGFTAVYAFTVGWSIPTQRALIMTTGFLLPSLMRRFVRFRDRYSIAAIIVLIAEPLAVLTASFWLSFGAVAILAYGMKSVQSLPKWQQAIVIQFIACIGLLPLSLWFFHSLSWVSPIMNAIAIPWVAFLMPIILLGGVVSLISIPIANAVLTAVCHALSPLVTLLSWGEGALITVPPFSVMGLLGLTLMVLVLLAPRGFPAKRLVLIALIPLFWPAQKLPENMATVTFLDVGQGLSVFVQTQNHQLLYDTGARYGHFDPGRRILLPFLQQARISRLDKVVISHHDNDHHGGLKSLRMQMPIDEILDPTAQYDKRCQAGQQWTWDGVTFEFLHPSPEDWDFNKNNQSCVLKISTGQKSVLLTGDIEKPAEQRLIKRYPEALASTVLLSPHHGSKTSSSEAFLERVSPELVIITAGFLNAYHHPHPSVMKRYDKTNLTVFETVKSGAITVTLSPEQVQTNHFLSGRRSFFYSHT